tara:strand:- start:6208 stop:6444 length:237 start_codon:yes stop_codon:yes gene_type:complete
MRTRAERRKHKQRMKKKAERIVRSEGWTDEEYVAHRVLRITENRKACSCMMCGNPRKMFGKKTIQERKSEDVLTILSE